MDCSHTSVTWNFSRSAQFGTEELSLVGTCDSCGTEIEGKANVTEIEAPHE